MTTKMICSCDNCETKLHPDIAHLWLSAVEPLSLKTEFHFCDKSCLLTWLQKQNIVPCKED